MISSLARDHYESVERVEAELGRLEGQRLVHPGAHCVPPDPGYLQYHREAVFERRFA